jgi:hypothetical protein
MKLIRWFRCMMNIGHRLVEKWWSLETAGMSEHAARNIWGSRVEDGKVQYFECLDCEAKLAPFEVAQRGWKAQA